MKLQLHTWIAFFMVAATQAAHATDAHQHGEKSHAHEQHAHVHGEAHLTVAFEALKGEIEFKVNAEALLGRETRPKTDKDKLADRNLVKKLETEWARMVELPAASACKLSKVAAAIDYDDHGGKTHADVEVDAEVLCEKPIVGGKMKIRLIENFPRIKKLQVDVVADDLQKGVVITTKIEEVSL